MPKRRACAAPTTRIAGFEAGWGSRRRLRLEGTALTKGKCRADQLLVDRGLAESRSRAQALILAGKVFQGDRRVGKAGDVLAEDATEVETGDGGRG